MEGEKEFEGDKVAFGLKSTFLRKSAPFQERSLSRHGRGSGFKAPL
jgi:hypothetical protein